MDIRVISIGTLPVHPLWGEQGPPRTGHATTTLIRTGKRNILVDPGLPQQAIAARLRERSGLSPNDITHVFVTTFQADTCRGIMAFEHATWWISQAEREGMGVPLVGDLQRAAADGEEELKARLELEVAILKRCEAAPDRLAPGVDLFPLAGVTPGCTGLLCAQPRSTIVVCGDAVPTVEHLERGLVLDSARDVTRARESFAEVVEIADFMVLGRDNLVPNPVKRPF